LKSWQQEIVLWPPTGFGKGVILKMEYDLNGTDMNVREGRVA